MASKQRRRYKLFENLGKTQLDYEIESIRGIGRKNTISDVTDGEGKRIAKDFLNLLVIEFAKQSSKYINGIFEAPFSYGERQLHSIIAPAISKITPLFLMEQPIQREWSKIRNENLSNTQGWLDYWCRYRNVDFFIELKHNFANYSSQTIRKKTEKDWSYMNKKQLNLIKKEAKLLSKYSKGVVLLSLHIIPIFERIKTDQNPESLQNVPELMEIHQNHFDNLKPKPNWGGLWTLKGELVYKCSSESENNKDNTFFPGVLFLSRISEIIN